MNWKYSIVFLGLLLVGCHHEITDADLVGTWRVDPDAKIFSQHPNMVTGMRMNWTADHKFSLTTPSPGGFEGTWTLDSSTHKVTVTPTVLVIQLPAGPRKMPIDQALAAMKANGANPEMIDGLTNISQPQTYDPSDGGKKLLQNGQLSLSKVGS